MNFCRSSDAVSGAQCIQNAAGFTPEASPGTRGHVDTADHRVFGAVAIGMLDNLAPKPDGTDNVFAAFGSGFVKRFIGIFEGPDATAAVVGDFAPGRMAGHPGVLSGIAGQEAVFAEAPYPPADEFADRNSGVVERFRRFVGESASERMRLHEPAGLEADSAHQGVGCVTLEGVEMGVGDLLGAGTGCWIGSGAVTGWRVGITV